MLFTASCSKSNEEVKQPVLVKPVKVLDIKTETKPVVLDYLGTVNYNELKKLGFKSPGKISKISVQKGTKIKKGDVLAKLDTKDLTFAFNAAKAQLSTAKTQSKKAQDAYTFANDTFARVKNMYDKNAISKQKYEEAKLQLDIRKSDLDQANELKNQAQTDYDHKQSLLEDATLKANSDGYVVDTLFSEGEIVAAGYPVVVIRNDKKIVNVGVTQEDVTLMHLGDKATVSANGIDVTAYVSNISEIPDKDTRTYNVEFALDENNFKIGFIVNAKIFIGQEKGIWIPIKSIKSNGKDYVFVVNNNEAKKIPVKILSINQSSVKVTGINDNDKLIIQGISTLVDGDKLKIEE